VEFWVGMRGGHTCVTYIAKSKTGSKEMQVIHFDQDVQVCGKFSYPIFCVYSNVIMNVLSLKTALEVGAILYPHWRASKYPLFSLSFFSTLEPSCVPFFSFAILRGSYFSLSLSLSFLK
jgi:hypothetical protein